MAFSYENLQVLLRRMKEDLEDFGSDVQDNMMSAGKDIKDNLDAYIDTRVKDIISKMVESNTSDNNIVTMIKEIKDLSRENCTLKSEIKVQQEELSNMHLLVARVRQASDTKSRQIQKLESDMEKLGKENTSLTETYVSRITEERLIEEMKSRFTLSQIIDMFIPNEDIAAQWGFYPIDDTESYSFYKEQIGNFWTPWSINFSGDYTAFNQLTETEKNLLRLTLGIFNFLDGGVVDNLVVRFMIEAETLKARVFYAAQTLIECFHGETYAMMIDTICPNESDRQNLRTAVNRMKFMKNYADLVKEFSQASLPLRLRQVCQGVLENLGFAAFFAVIFYFKYGREEPAKINGILFGNQEILKDECLHAEYAFMMYQRQFNPDDKDYVETMIRRMVEISFEAINELLPQDLPTMSNEDLKNYVKFIADVTMVKFGFEKIWHVKNPLTWMSNLGQTEKPQIFERQSAGYQTAQIEGNLDPSNLPSDF